MKRLVCILFLFFAGSIQSAAQPSDIITHRTPDAVYLRWKPVRTAETMGYHVYRQANDAQWERLTPQPLERVKNIEQARTVLRADAEMFLKLFDLPQGAGEIDDARFLRVAGDERNAFFLNILSIVNPRVAVALGEMYIDSDVPSGARVRYRIARVASGGERILVETSELVAGIPDRIPVIEGFEAIPSHETVTLRWRKNPDAMRNGSLVTWNVYRAFDVLGPYERMNPSPILPLRISTEGDRSVDDFETFGDLYLANGKTLFYYVRPVNAFGIEGEPTVTAQTTPGDTSKLQAPANIRAQMFGTGILLEWETENAENVRGYEIYAASGRDEFSLRHSSELLETPNETRYIDLRVAEGREHRYLVRAVDRNGRPGEFSDTVSLLLPDVTPPQIPKNVRAKSERNRIVLSWDANTEPDLRGYYVERSGDAEFRDYIVLNNSPVRANTFADTLRPDIEAEFAYVVYAEDHHGNRSAGSPPVKARPLDETAPRPPKITTLRREEKTVSIAWTRSPERDVAAYILWRSVKDSTKFQQAATTSETNATDQLPGPGRYWYAISARDASGNASIRSTAMELVYSDDTPPPAPYNVKTSVRHERIVLSWDKAPTGVTGWMVARKLPDGSKRDLAQVKTPRTEYTDAYADARKEQVYYVRAFDARWRTSEEVEVRFTPK